MRWPRLRRKDDVVLPGYRDLRFRKFRIEGETFMLERWSRDYDGSVRIELREESAFRVRYGAPEERRRAKGGA